MPKESAAITRFDLGMVTSIDPQDIPLESAIYSENLDSNAFGRLQGILANSLKFAGNSTIGANAIGINNWLRRETGEYDLIYTDNTHIKSIRDFYGSASENTEISNKVPTSMVKLNRSMHMGTGSAFNTPPQFIGWGGDFRKFGGMGTTYFTGSGGDVTTANWDIWGLYTGVADTTLTIEITDITYTSPPGVYDAHLRWTIDGGSTWYAKNGFLNSEIITLSEGMYTRVGDISKLQIGFTLSMELHIKNTVSMIKGNAELVTYEHGSNVRNPNTAKYSLYDMAGVGIVLVSGASVSASFDKRVTAANIYRAEDSTGNYRWRYSLIYDGLQESLLSEIYLDRGTVVEDSLTTFRLVKSALIADGDEWISRQDVSYSFFIICDGVVGDLAQTGVSYEQNSGVLENADTNLPYYELGCSLNNAHFVAKCYVDGIPDAKMMLFKSVEFCYDVFDIYNDKVPLNILPTAIAGFNNKIYVWDFDTTVIINASNLSIENIIHGTGCLSPLSYTIIDTMLDDKPYRALVWADSHDIYMDEGAGARPISDAIRTRINSNTVSWADMQHTSINPMLVFDAPRNTLLCITSSNYSGNLSDAFAYHIVSKRWDYYPLFCNNSITMGTNRLCKSAFSGKNGETYCVNGYQVLRNFGVTTTLTGTIDIALDMIPPYAIVGVGTLFITELAVGDRILVSGLTLIVAIISDATNLIVTTATTDVANDTAPKRLINNRAWKYYSPELIFGFPKQPKVYYNFYLDKVETIGTVTPTYSVNKGSSYASLTSSTEIKTGGVWEKTNSIILALVGTLGINYVNAIELLYRKMVGVR